MYTVFTFFNSYLFHRDNVLFSLHLDIRDPLLRSFTLRNANPFSALKMYIKQTDDKELEAKVGIVEKYGCQIPELVKILERCFEPDFNKAGMQKKNVFYIV